MIAILFDFALYYCRNKYKRLKYWYHNVILQCEFTSYGNNLLTKGYHFVALLVYKIEVCHQELLFKCIL